MSGKRKRRKAKAIEWHRINLKCDAASCDHEEQVAEISASLIGKPCPRCGANLLTQEDYESAKALETVVDFVNDIVPPRMVSDEPGCLLGINPHGNSLNLTLKPPSEKSAKP